DPSPAGIAQLTALFEPDRELGAPGLFIAGRVFGEGDDTAVEPVLGYRRILEGGAVALAGMIYGTHQQGSERQASYEANRGGLEVSGDVRLLDDSRWF